MLQPTSVPAIPFLERLRTPAGRRTFGFVLALLIETLILLLLLTLGPGLPPGNEKASPTVVTFLTDDVSEETSEARSPEARPEQPAERQPETPRPETPEQAQPAAPPQPPTPAPAPPAPILPMDFQLRPSTAPPRSAAPSAPARPSFGPADNRPAHMRDTERVGTAPNGEPLYAAEWYREPSDTMMRSYLSTARGPGWALIACRTASDYRVEDCVGLGEYPEGSQILRSTLAAAWEFRVRPPRRGGNPLVGAWVRIRISYGERR